jgi:acyl carrier protein
MLEDKVIEIITRVQKLEPGRVTIDSTFEELGIDSLDGVNLLFAFEEEFNLNIPEHVALQMKSVRQVTEGLQGLQAGLEAKKSSEA